MKGKYVVGLSLGHYGTVVAAMLFPESVVHADVAERFFGGKSRVVSAGFYHVQACGTEVEVKNYGQSDSLNIKSRDVDLQYIEQALGLREYLEGPQPRHDTDLIQKRVHFGHVGPDAHAANG